VNWKRLTRAESTPERLQEFQVRAFRREGRRIRRQGETEAELERRGRQIDFTGTMGPQSDTVGRLQEVVRRREVSGAGRREIGGVVGPGGARVFRGTEGRITGDQFRARAQQIQGELAEVSTIHTHPTPSPASVGDLMFLLNSAGRRKGSPPDFIVTSEGVFRLHSQWEGKPLTTEQRKAVEQGVQKDVAEGVMANRMEAARQMGIKPYEIDRVLRTYHSNEASKLTRNELAFARRATRDFEVIIGKVAEEIGFEITRVTPEAATRELRSLQGLAEARTEPAKEVPERDILEDYSPEWLQMASERIPPEGRYGEKVYVSALYDAVRAIGEDISLPEFKTQLLNAMKRGEIRLTRADLVEAMDKDMLAASEIQDGPARFNFVEFVRRGNAPTEAAMRSQGRPTEVEGRSIPQTPSGQRQGPGSLQVPPTTQVQPTPGVEPVRARDIILEMQGRPGTTGFRIPFTGRLVGKEPGDPVQVPFARGKLRPMSTLGVFKVFENLIRTQDGRDLAVAAHEWSHAMHRHTTGRGGEGFWLYAEAQLAEALKKDFQIQRDVMEVLKNYPGAKDLEPKVQWAEAWAEWHARNLLGDATLDAEFPHLSNYMRGFLAKNPRLLPQYDRIQGMMERYNRQGSLAREERSIIFSSDKPTEAELAQRPGWWTRASRWFEKAWIDDMALLKRSQDKWIRATGRDPADVPIMDDPARLLDALRMTASKTTESFVRRGIKLPGREKIPPLTDIMKMVEGKERDFVLFISAIRNVQLHRRGKKTTLPLQDHLNNVKVLGRANPEFRRAALRLKEWTDAVVDYVGAAGALGPDEVAAIKDAYVVYLPFFRAIDKMAGGSRKPGEQGGSGIRKIEGSTLEVVDPIVSLQDQTQRLIARAHQHTVLTSLYKLAQGQEAGGLATVVPRNLVPKDHPVKQVLDALAKALEGESAADELLDSIRAVSNTAAVTEKVLTFFTQSFEPPAGQQIIAFIPRPLRAGDQGDGDRPNPRERSPVSERPDLVDGDLREGRLRGAPRDRSIPPAAVPGHVFRSRNTRRCAVFRNRRLSWVRRREHLP
jgi:hypothetical protein